MSLFENENEELITTLSQLYNAVESDLATISGTDADELVVDEDVYVVTTPEKFEEFTNEISQLLQQDYPDYEVTFLTSEENGNVIISGYKIKYIGQ